MITDVVRLMPLAGYPQPPKKITTVRTGVPCTFAGCNNVTKDGKPFCPAHVDQNSYVKDILKEIKNSEKEAIMALKNKRVVKNGFIDTELLAILKTRNRATSLEKLSVLADYDLPVVEVYVKSAIKRKLLTMTKNNHGTLQVKYIGTE